MNLIYGLLNMTAQLFEELATLTKKNGREITVYLSAESPLTESIGGNEYPASQNETIFTAALDSLRTNGTTTYPEEGDIITGQFGAISPQRWKVITDGSTATAWSWMWGRPGERIQFKAQKIAADA